MGLTKTQSGGLADDAKTTINNNADNRLITGSGTANTLEGESGLTFASKILDLNQGNNSANTINGTLQFSNVNHSVAKIEGYTRTTEDDGDIRFYTKNSGTFTEGLRLSFHAEPKLQMLAGETEIVSDATEAALTLRADPGQNRSSSSIKFDVDATVRGRFTSDGLCFGSDTAAANALNDYEEGTFTPEYNSGNAASACMAINPTYSAQVGVYRKIGNMVFFQIKIEASSATAKSGQLQINGLPFTSGNFNSNTTAGGAVISLTGAFSNTDHMPTVFIGGSSTSLKFFQTNASNWAGTDLNSATGTLHLTGQYPTS